MDDLTDLYQEIILDHNRRPRNYGALPGADRSAEGYNPLCGDQIRVTLRLEGDRVADLAFAGEGCAISRASASVMTAALRGQSVESARALLDELIDLVTRPEDPLPGTEARLGELAAFLGVRAYPSRVKCATLAWHALRKALGAPDERGRPGSLGDSGSPTASSAPESSATSDAGA